MTEKARGVSFKTEARDNVEERQRRERRTNRSRDLGFIDLAAFLLLGGG